jgi:hypothetical protein
MAVVRVDALCQCEGCDKRFGVELELADDFKGDFEEMTRERIRNGDGTYYVLGVRGKHTVDRFPLGYWPTIQGGLMLCDECSRKCDDVPKRETEALTKAEVLKALQLVEGDEDDA